MIRGSRSLDARVVRDNTPGRESYPQAVENELSYMISFRNMHLIERMEFCSASDLVFLPP